MSSNEGERRRRRAKERRNREKRKHAIRLATYPEFVIDETDGAPPFVAAVRTLLDQFDFKSNRCCSPQFRTLCELFKRIGLSGLDRRRELLEAAGHTVTADFTVTDGHALLMHLLLTQIGTWVFQNLPKRYTEKPLPYHYFNIEPLEDSFRVGFSFLPSIRVAELSSPIFSSPLGPSIEMGGGTWKIGFTDHALERACTRISRVHPITYPDFFLCHHYFENCIYFEPLTLQNGQVGVKLWNEVTTESEATYVSQLLNEHTFSADRRNVCYVVGYCPLEIIRFHAVAKTVLFPGYRNTPEAALLNAASLPQHLHENLKLAAENNTLARLLSEETVDVMRWYHQNGVPQVRELSQPLFGESPHVVSLGKRLHPTVSDR
jgi:hypothetical protein